MIDFLREKKLVLVSLISLSFLFVGFGTNQASGFWLNDVGPGDLQVIGYFKNSTSVHLHGPGEVMKCQNLLNLELTYNVKNFLEPSSELKFFAMFRPEYDAVFDVTNEGLGGSGHENRQHLQDNFGRNDDINPLVRELWVQVKHKGFDARLGRQIVVWGRSIGFPVLDFINPVNWREFVLDDYEDYKIPLWMLNFNYWFDADHSFQFILIPRHVPDYHAPIGSPWAFDVNKFVYGTVVPMLRSFGFKVKRSEPATTFNNSEIALRWKGRIKRLYYSLNYFWTWERLEFLHQRGFTMVIQPDRLQIYGGSFDYAFDNFFGLDNVVINGEFALLRKTDLMNQNNVLKEKDEFRTVLSWERNFFVDWTVILQYFRFGLVHPSDNYGGFVAGEFRDNAEIYYSITVQKFLLEGDKMFLTLQFFAEDDGGSWSTVNASYELTDNIKFKAGFHLFNGDRSNAIGEFHNQDQFFFEVKYSF